MGTLGFKFLEDKLEKEKNYWSHKLGGELVQVRLAGDFRSKEGGPGKQQALGLVFAESLVSKVRKVCGQSEPLIFTALVSSLKICLHKYTGAEDVIVGTTIHEKYAGTATLNRILALRDEVSGVVTGRQLLQSVKRTLAEAYEHQKYPYEKIVDRLKLNSTNHRSGLFSVGVMLENISNKQYLKELRNDLDLCFSVNGEQIGGVIEYNSTRFKRETVELFGEHYLEILGTLLDYPDLKIGKYELLSAAGKQHYLYEFNETGREYPGAKTLVQLYEEQVAQTPTNWAASFGGRRLTYEQLNGRANQLAHQLRGQGVGAGTLVGIYLEHSLEMVVALLGTLKAGAAYVPIDPEHPRVRREMMIKDAGLQLLLTQERLRSDWEAVEVATLCLDRQWEVVGRQSAENPSWEVLASDLAYVIYTSGSTGPPKGIKIAHEALVNYLCWAKEVYLGQEQLDFPLYSSLSFDLTVTSIYVPLLSGSRVVVYRKDQWESPLLKILQDDEVGVVKLTPSHLMLIKDGDNRQSRIKRLIVGGEALSTALARQVYDSFGGKVEIYNEYGPTEATVGCMLYRYQPEQDERSYVPIGRPAANTQIYLLDERGQPVAPNLKGELCIAGAGLAQGYLNRAGLTAEKFIDNPFVPGQKMYRSGDLGRFLPEGVIEYLGRQDEQVKFHGHRVELNEIRSALNQHPQIRDSVVLLSQDARGNAVLIAYYVSRQELEAGQVRSFLAQQLIEETIPNVFVHLERMPLTLNGKINYQALPSLKEARHKLQQEYAAPQTPLEEILAGIWAEVLGLQRVGLDDNFFTVGGHSLLATQVISRIREAFQVEIMLRTLFEKPTVRGLATSIEQALHAGVKVEVPPIQRVPRKTAMPLSFAQQRMWFLHQLVPESPFYNIPVAMRVRGPLDQEAMEATLSEIVQRHEVLRTAFREAQGEPVQEIGAAEAIRLPVVDLRGLQGELREAEALRLALEEAHRPFDMSQPPLLRVVLLRMAEAERIICLTMHHIVSDGWSTGVLVREVAALYEANAQGKESPLPELPIQYADFAVWQREWMQGAVLEEQLSYWREQLDGAPTVLELPTDRARPAVQTHRGARQRISLAESMLRGLRELSQREGTTLFMTLLAAFQTLLSRYSGQEDILVGSPVANRNRAEMENLIGFFVNTLVLRAELRGNPSFRELLRQVREVTLGAYAHQDLPFERLVDELQPERDLSRQPLFQVMFALQNVPHEELELVGLKLSRVEITEVSAKFDLMLVMGEAEHELLGSLEYNSDLFDESSIKDMCRHFQNLLENIVANPDGRLHDLQMLSEEEHFRLEQPIIVEEFDTNFSF